MEFRRHTGLALVVSALLMLGTKSLHADPLDLKDLDATVFEKLRAKSTEHTNVTLDGSVLKMAAGFLSSSDDENAAKFTKLVAGLRSVTVRTFEFKNPGAYTTADVDSIRRQVKLSDWTRIVDTHSKEDGDNAEIYILPGKDKPQGLFVIAWEPLELTVVQILGAVDLKDLGALEDLGVPDVGDSMRGKGNK